MQRGGFDIQLQNNLRIWSRVLACIVLITGVLVLIGWQFSIPVLKNFLSRGVAMNPLTAVCFILTAVALFLLNKKNSLGRGSVMLISFFLVITGFSKLLSLLFHFHWDYDLMIFRELIRAEGKNGIPNSMAPNTAAAVFLSGVALFFFVQRKWGFFRFVHIVAFLVGIIGLSSVIGYLYHVQTLYVIRAYIPMALNTAICFVAVSLAILFYSSDVGYMADFTTKFTGSVVARRFVPAAIIITVVMGLLRLIGEFSGFYSRESGTALLVTGIIVAFLVLIHYNAVMLNKSDALEEEAEEILKKSNARFLTIIEMSPVAMSVTDLEDGKILHLNEEYEKVFGFAREEVLGRSSAELKILDQQFWDQVISILKGEGRVKGMEARLNVKNGGVKDMLVSVELVELDGKSSLLSSFVDITERKKSEEKIVELNRRLEENVKQLTSLNAELRETNKDLEAFTYTVSHDLRAPLRAIDGFARILSGSVKDLDADNKILLDKIAANVKKMNRLIEDLLAFSRLGKKELQKTFFSAAELVNEIIGQVKNETNPRARVIIHELPVLYADRSLMEQVFVNLISNALKYSRNTTEPVVEIGYEKGLNENIIYTRDNGVGFDMKYYDRLFSVFQRLHSQQEFEGTGVGLAIVQRIVTRHGGRVWGEGKVNEGAVFRFSLPTQ